MRKKVACSILIIVLVCVLSLTTKTIEAWLHDKKTTEEVTFSLGKVQYQLSGSLTTGPVVPGENIILTPFILQNHSTITTELRLKVLNDNLFSEINLGEAWRLQDDGYYYYQYKISPDINQIIVLEALVFDGNIINNDYSGKKIGISILFEAKQAEYVTWEELGKITL